MFGVRLEYASVLKYTSTSKVMLVPYNPALIYSSKQMFLTITQLISN